MKHYITIATFTYAHEIQVLRHLLDQHEIPHVFENETLVALTPFYSNAMGGIKLKVPRAYAQTVIDLINNLDASEHHLHIV